MPDIFSKEKRSEVMSRIRGRDTKMEREFKAGYSRIVEHPDFLPFRPDFCVRVQDETRVIFLDSTFWHGFVSVRALARMDRFWAEKMARNILRDFCADAFWDCVQKMTKGIIIYERIGEKTWRRYVRDISSAG